MLVNTDVRAVVRSPGKGAPLGVLCLQVNMHRSTSFIVIQYDFDPACLRRDSNLLKARGRETLLFVVVPQRTTCVAHT